jgi:hypothetical protein
MDRFIKLNNSINTVGYPNVIEDENGNLVYNAIPDYLYFTALEDMTIKYSGSYLQYSTDCKTWIPLNANKYSDTIKKGTTIYIRTSSSVSSLGQFTVTGRFNVGGSLKELLSSATEKKYSNLFSYNANLIDASGLVLHEYGKYIYRNMFNGCTSLVKAPVFTKVRTLPDYACASMFSGCTSLLEAPLLPFEELGSHACEYVFYECTSLVKATHFPMNEIGYESCRYMFYGCTSLEEAPAIIALTNHHQASAGLESMFSGCTSLVKAPDIFVSGNPISGQMLSSMFAGCTSLTTPPAFIGNISGCN